ncbi:unnamed protein product [Closterium sp. Naga37s-1]|nr:unnamed protein product [Closterium sp. Naga37s-1]
MLPHDSETRSHLIPPVYSPGGLPNAHPPLPHDQSRLYSRRASSCFDSLCHVAPPYPPLPSLHIAFHSKRSSPTSSRPKSLLLLPILLFTFPPFAFPPFAFPPFAFPPFNFPPFAFPPFTFPPFAFPPFTFPPFTFPQVAFQALIPCFLMTKVASTLAVQPLTSLAALPFLAVIQVLCGIPLGRLACLPPSLFPLFSRFCTAYVLQFALSSILCGAALALGKLACTIAYRRPSSLSSLPSPPAARHIAFSVAQSLGLSPSAAALLSGLPPPKREGAVEGKVGGGKVAPGRGVLSAPGMVGAAERAAGRKEAVVMSACAFGNSLTLPLVFLATLLTRADADRAAGYLALFMVGAAGYLALFMVGWSPTFWTLGYSMFPGGDNKQEEGERVGGDMFPGGDNKQEERERTGEEASAAAAVAAEAMGVTGFEHAVSRVMAVVQKVLAGLLIGATPLSHFFLPASSSSAAAAASLPAYASPWLFSPATAGILHGIMEVLWLFSPATAGILHSIMEVVGAGEARHAGWRTTLRQMACLATQPPSSLPPATAQAAAILGSACVAVQAVVLASSLASSIPSRISLSWPKPSSSPSSTPSPSPSSSSPSHPSSPTSAATAASVSAAIEQLLPPAANTEVTALSTIPTPAASVSAAIEQLLPPAANTQVTALVPMPVQGSTPSSLVLFSPNQLPALFGLSMREIRVESRGPRHSASVAAPAGGGGNGSGGRLGNGGDGSTVSEPAAGASLSSSAAASPSSSAAALPSLLDDRALWVVCAVRLLLLPMLGTVGIMVRRCPLLPSLFQSLPFLSSSSLSLPIPPFPLLFFPLSSSPSLSSPLLTSLFQSLPFLSSSFLSLPIPPFPLPFSLSLPIPPLCPFLFPLSIPTPPLPSSLTLPTPPLDKPPFPRSPCFSGTIQTAMPSAQNLVLMSQLSPATKPLAGMLASLMLRQVPATKPLAGMLASLMLRQPSHQAAGKNAGVLDAATGGLWEV